MNIQKDLEVNLNFFISFIGTGTFGRVIVVHDKCSQQYYALKVLIIEELVRLKQVEHVKNEKSILMQLNHPFIVKLYWTGHDAKFLYMLFEYVCGGELFKYLREVGHFSSETTRFYTSEIILALKYLHSLNIVYRDLKPENLLLDYSGHLKMTDFGFAKHVKDRTYSLCGTPEYLAPEILQGKGHNHAADWWTTGIIIYEMLVGFILMHFIITNRSIVRKFLRVNLNERLGSSKLLFANDLLIIFENYTDEKCTYYFCLSVYILLQDSMYEILEHPWFSDICWSDVFQRKLKPPIIPNVQSDGDTCCYEQYFEQDWSEIPLSSISSRNLFKEF
ncbi:protein kinase X [Schistosoma bovis]|uniref:Protein kinase X n=1 Tax=Schistosoma bovis TaxID=6184 RepID=A0A430QJR6_SCHBO|nr:protein kinase X [Schistosoma bovis]